MRSAEFAQSENLMPMRSGRIGKMNENLASAVAVTGRGHGWENWAVGRPCVGQQECGLVDGFDSLGDPGVGCEYEGLDEAGAEEVGDDEDADEERCRGGFHNFGSGVWSDAIRG